MKPLFTEIQRFNQWWIWLIISVTCVVPIYGFYKQIIQNKPFGDNTMSNTSFILTTVVLLTIIIVFLLIRLETSITKESITFKFSTFLKRTYSFNEIETYKIINYGFVGGWGIRYTMKYGTVYNTKGSKGMFIKLKNGKTMVIGTQKPYKLKKVIDNLNS